MTSPVRDPCKGGTDEQSTRPPRLGVEEGRIRSVDPPVEGEEVMAVEVKPFCRTHQRMGDWKVVYFYEDLGDGVMSAVDSVDLIVCEEC